jgi:hypothetical protein
MENETDKYKNREGRKAADKERDSQYLNQESLDDDLIDTESDDDTDEGPGIVNSENPDTEEWNVREYQNKH